MNEEDEGAFFVYGLLDVWVDFLDVLGKGLTGKQAAWNKGVFGSVKWSEEAKRMQSERVRAIWAKRKQEALCRQQVL